ncbi:kinase [Sesbania bispinosa]|nr:kinase [Sesbania bispinosa]
MQSCGAADSSKDSGPCWREKIVVGLWYKVEGNEGTVTVAHNVDFIWWLNGGTWWDGGDDEMVMMVARGVARSSMVVGRWHTVEGMAGRW